MFEYEVQNRKTDKIDYFVTNKPDEVYERYPDEEWKILSVWVDEDELYGGW